MGRTFLTAQMLESQIETLQSMAGEKGHNERGARMNNFRN